MCSDTIPPPVNGCQELPDHRQWIAGVVEYFNPDTGEMSIFTMGGDTYTFTLIGDKLEEFRKTWIARSPEFIGVRIKL